MPLYFLCITIILEDAVMLLYGTCEGKVAIILVPKYAPKWRMYGEIKTLPTLDLPLPHRVAIYPLCSILLHRA